MTEHEHGLGRWLAPDPRDREYPARRLLAATSAPTRPRAYRYWNANGWWGDQGSSPMCVGYSWAHWLKAGPNTQRHIFATKASELAVGGYHLAQRADEWPGEGYDGTSVRAGAKVHQRWGYVGSYWWATNIHEVVEAILNVGPVVVGTVWTEAMFSPDADGFIHPSGADVGGHAYLLDGVNRASRTIRLKNSWGRSWGNRGHAFISLENMARLLDRDGEACVATELTPKDIP